jgi:hypothetical protein
MLYIFNSKFYPSLSESLINVQNVTRTLILSVEKGRKACEAVITLLSP